MALDFTSLILSAGASDTLACVAPGHWLPVSDEDTVTVTWP